MLSAADRMDGMKADKKTEVAVSWRGTTRHGHLPPPQHPTPQQPQEKEKSHGKEAQN